MLRTSRIQVLAFICAATGEYNRNFQIFHPYHRFILMFIILLTYSIPKTVALLLTQANSQFRTSASNGKKDLDCTSNRERMDECGLAQGFSFIFTNDHAYPTNHSALLKACKRQSDAFKCLKQYSKCLSPLSRQVLSAIIAGRIKYNKRLCAETVGDFNGKFIDTFKCMSKIKPLMEKGHKAEAFAATVSEGIANTKLNSSDVRLKHACCAVSEIKRVSFINFTR